jgi:TRAP-type mannitol/chloroaromatic compound transport system permease small subunit
MTSVDRLLSGLQRMAKWLALPVAQAGSRETNDLGQWLFALFVAVSISAATRAREHIATDVIAARFSPAVRSWLTRLGIGLAVLPWALFVLWAAAPQIAQSVRLAERFPDTANPGYFMVKVALGALLVLVLVQALIDLVRGERS